MGPQPPRVSFFAEHEAVGIVIHNTEGANRDPLSSFEREKEAAFENAREIQRSHFNRGFSDTGQHFTISQGGIICEGRHGTIEAAKAGHVVRGAHSPGANDEWWGIEIAGDNRQRLVITQQQTDALIALGQFLSQLAGKKLRLQPHDHFRDTTCPGKIKSLLPDLREKIGATE